MAAATRTAPSQAEVDTRLSFARAALGVAGHEVTDPVLKYLLERVAREEITAEQAVADARRHVQG